MLQSQLMQAAPSQTVNAGALLYWQLLSLAHADLDILLQQVLIKQNPCIQLAKPR
jgi:hypothetical protein